MISQNGREGKEMICPFCGDEMEHWNQGIYECKDCEVMIPDDIDDDYASEI
ncbi:hypothetical protein ROSALIND_48 [Paenibacillus phage Rosalind]|uniref:Uncharacterized protein n=4 Tax=Vegasvirus vegas TaxID=2034999 RepID=A0A0K2CZE5_9CAUD|nr:hypothetical protein VEGAS_59 [Paenibacillus phage Vegas]ALA12787.1 hypothetical protein HAYLEY_57 [Paenibacillus phage Hayley]ALA12874.1 hypothetical protein VADIM_59 [Paenibacillus phage Vadim]ALA12960.1 hypothetical protein DIANE_59 [Paenibacillus phage Diane]UYE92074.1 hypothetical protein LUNBUN_50 [Paenibacillus phage LunBun]UYE92156.1 hypothetical protein BARRYFOSTERBENICIO_50 [Paenibacillus phage BarryFoster_Benicio]UYL91520.1 hypothetical protein ABATENZ_50 [Paenibacillus phage AB